MQTSARVRETGPSFAARKGHIPRISINDDEHHVTEAIGHMYGDDGEQDTRRHARTANKTHSPPRGGGGDVKTTPDHGSVSLRSSIPRKRLPERKTSSSGPALRQNGQAKPPMDRGYSWETNHGSPSPPLGLRGRSPSQTATSSFPLNDIDYESSPAAVAQELSNLQALRRMSMDVAAAGDPDLPTLNPAAMPASPSQSEDDDSRLFWVPARLHPELAPKEFKTFLDSKAEQIRRRSGELSAFNPPPSSRSGSLSAGDSVGGLRRKKSMLSRTINSSTGYQDGAERLERKRSMSRRSISVDPNLEELESLVGDGQRMQRMSLDTSEDDIRADVILPSVPSSSLKRSTRTAYRRGGSVKGKTERLPYAQRAARRGGGIAGEDLTPVTPSLPDVPALPAMLPFNEISSLSQTLRDPTESSATAKSATNFSRPAGRTPSPPESLPRVSISSAYDSVFTRDDASTRSSISSNTEPSLWSSQALSPARPFSGTSSDRQAIPQIVEVPPAEEQPVRSQAAAALSSAATIPIIRSQQQMHLPERTSSREDPPRIKASPTQRPPMPPKQPSPNRPPSRGNANPPQNVVPTQRPQSLQQMSATPSPLPGNDTNTGNLSFIPTLTEDRRADGKKNKDKKEEKKSGWGWFLGKEEAEKEKPRAKSPKLPEKHDNTRLDVLQTSIESTPGKGRESLVLDRDSLRLEEERKKESQRKSAVSDNKKEKEGLFSSFFGGKKGKPEKETAPKKHHSRGLSPEPPHRELKPDVDYNWTRFSILEERAIYRMAHIKLANPRRALYSQVLLSNFMYSYLAKVQQMHPQMNLPTSAKQQKSQQQKAKEQPDEFTQYQRYQQQQQQHQQEPPTQHYQSTPPPQQQHPAYATHQGYDGDHTAYDYDKAGQRPTSRGSKSNGSSVENGVSHSHAPSGAYNHQGQYTHASSSRHAPGHGSLDRDHDDDYDDDMW